MGRNNMTIQLDGQFMTDRTALHDLLQKSFSFPDYYGRNLDALYDLLTEISVPTEIQIINVDLLQQQLGAYGAAFLVTLHQAAEKSPYLNIEEYK